MEILMLVLLYYLSQNADFATSVKPIMDKLKGSEQMLRFLNDLSKFTQTFSTFASDSPPKKEDRNTPNSNDKPADKKEPQSPTTGIADEFIQTVLESYLKNRES